MTSLVLTITETLRYRGKIGQWSWVLHRIAGLGTLVFLVMHVIDTSWATFYPELYAKAIAAYKTPLFTLGEFGLVACVVYHALNGFRIALFDYRPKWWRHQATAAKVVFLATVVILVPVFLAMFGHVLNFYNERTTAFDLGLEQVVEAVSPFVVGTVVILLLALLVSLVASVVPGLGGFKYTPKAQYKGSKQSLLVWQFMRISGVLIIPLVFGHLAMVHVINGVFDITKLGHIPFGTNLGANMLEVTVHGVQMASAAKFVELRWNTLLAGVYIWRVYDILLLVLVVVHGFNGARYVMEDYTRNPVVRRALNIAFFGTMIGVLLVGALAILQTAPGTAEKMLNQASQIIIK